MSSSRQPTAIDRAIREIEISVQAHQAATYSPITDGERWRLYRAERDRLIREGLSVGAAEAAADALANDFAREKIEASRAAVERARLRAELRDSDWRTPAGDVLAARLAVEPVDLARAA